MNWLANIARMLKDVLRLLTGIGRGQWQTRFGGTIAAMFAGLIGSMVLKLLQFIGVTMVINHFAMPAIMPFITQRMLGLPPEWQAFLSMTRADHAVTILVSAMGISVAQKIRFKPSNPSLWS